MNHPNILIVEDNQANFAVLDYLLRAHGFHVLAAGNGREALDVLAREPVDLVLCDMQMPVMDGYAATRAIREFEAETGATPTPIIALTAHAIREDVARCLAAGCSSHLPKPIRRAALMSAINEATSG